MITHIMHKILRIAWWRSKISENSIQQYTVNFKKEILESKLPSFWPGYWANHEYETEGTKWNYWVQHITQSSAGFLPVMSWLI